MVKRKFQNYQEKLTKNAPLGQSISAGKEVLIKYLAQSLPEDLLSVLKFPLGLCDYLNQIIRKYWRGTEKGKRKIHSKVWD